MTQQQSAPEPTGSDWMSWGRRLSRYLSQTRSALVHQTGGESAADDGQIMWDRENQYPVASKNGVWRQIVLEDSYYTGSITTDQTAALADTPYALAYTPRVLGSITVGTPSSRLVFTRAGEYVMSFSAQISSGSGNTINFWFWFRVNGVDVERSSKKTSLANNSAVMVVSRSIIFNFSAGDYLEMMWATDNTSGKLDASAATAFAPSAPASTLSLTRLNG